MRWVLFVTAALVLVISSLVIASRRYEPPALIIDETVTSDFGVVASDIWNRFTTAFPAQESCIGRVTLVADYQLDDRARYSPEGRTMAVRVPAPKVLLDRAVVHELAHHLEFACASQVEMRSAFLASLGLHGAAWFEGAEWGLIPSEIFAEAVVEYVLDERGRLHTDLGLIDQDAVDVVIRWAVDG